MKINTLLKNIDTLEDLWVYCEFLNAEQFPDSSLKPIMGGGKLFRPRFMFVFINPTYKNISSDPVWSGKRRPWTGTKNIWRIFNQAGHFPSDLLAEIEKTKEWDAKFADKVYSYLNGRGFYFTNLVKWTGENSDLPNRNKVDIFLPLLKREIELVEPDFIVTFGHIPFNALTSEKIKLKDYYQESIRSQCLETFDVDIGKGVYKLIPCYFPVGRGNPKRAVDLLKLIPYN